MRRKVGSTARKVSGTRKRKTTRRRRRGIGAAGNMTGMLMTAAGLVAGAVAARELNTVIVKQFPSFSPLMSGVAQMAVGFVLPMVVKNNKFVTDLGYGMVANGGMVTIVSTGLITGPQNTMRYRINGPLQLSAVSGANQLKVISGLNDRPRLTTERTAPRVKHSY